MRRWPLAFGLLALLGIASVARGESASCVIRLVAPASPHLGKATSLAAVLASLPEPPLETRALLAAGRAVEAPGTASEALASPGPAGHPFAAWQVLRFASAAAMAASLPRLRAHPGVVDVEPVRSLGLCDVSAAPPRRQQAGAVATLGTIPWNVERVGAPAALAAVVPDSGIVVAVIDTGADLDHPDLERRLWRNDDLFGNASPADDATDQNGDGLVEEWERHDDDDNGYVDDFWGYDFTDAPGQGGSGDATTRDNIPDDDNGHGTHVAGIIAADGALRGVAPFVRLMPVRAAYNQFFGSGALETDDAAAAIVYAVDNGARVVNLSWGDREESILVRAAIDYAVAHDVVVVAAVGNGGRPGPHYPSADPRVLGVTASNRNGARAAFSNFGAAAGVGIGAPGEEAAFPGAGIWSLVPRRLDNDGTSDGLGEKRGTSMAAPHVAGLAAIVLCRADRPDAMRTRALLIAAARRAAGADWSADLGYGEADGLRAVQTDDDLTVAILGPEQFYRANRFTLVGTVLSGDLPRRSLRLMHAATGSTRTLVADVVGQVVADTLADADVGDLPEGDWECTLEVRSADGRQREWHGSFRLDRTPPVVDTLRVQSAWRSGEPRWLVSLRCDDPVRVRVTPATGGAPLLADAGYATYVQMESPQARVDSAWIVTLENAAGGGIDVPVARPPALAVWPVSDVIESVAQVGFTSTAVWGRSPLGPVVWGRASGTSGTTMQALAVVDNQLVKVYDAGRDGLPRGYADANGDGAADLVFQALSGDSLGVLWLLTRSAGSFPDSIAALQRGLRSLGMHQLDDDPPFETVLAREEELLLFDDAAGRAPGLIQSLDNPLQTGFNSWGADAIAGDWDGDGRIELACGDVEGFVCVYERGANGVFALESRFDTHGTYAYDLSVLPEGGFLVGAQRSVDAVGDGFPSTVYEFTAHSAAGERRYAFMTRENSLDTGSAVARSPATGATWLALVHGSDLYLARGDAEPREPQTWRAIASGEPPVLADLDDDGQLEILLTRRGVAVLYRLREETLLPHGLRSESLGRDRLRLTWVPGASGTSRVERLDLGNWTVLGTTPGNTWVDSLLVPFAEYRYRIVDVAGDSVTGISNRLLAIAQPLPRLVGVEIQGGAALRLRLSNAMHPATLVPWRFRVASGDTDHRVQQLSVAEDGRAVDLLLDAPLACDRVVVCADSLRDAQWGLLDPAGRCVALQHECGAEAFYVVSTLARSGGIEIAWSRAPDAVALAPASYELTWNGAPVPVVGVEPQGPTGTLLQVPPESPLVGRGIPYLLRVMGPVRAAGDGAPLADAATVHRVYVDGSGAAHVFPVPNPARGTEVVFAEAAADTRIHIFNLEGVLVRELREPLGGGLRWDLRGTDGAPVASGVYLYVARDGRGSSRGRLAVLR